jgi:hypothetical protein
LFISTQQASTNCLYCTCSCSQCSGSVSFWASRIWIRYSEVRIQIRFGAFHHQAKIVRKTLISTLLGLLYDFFSLKHDVNLPSKSNKQKNSKNNFCGILKFTDEKSRIQLDPDPLVNGTNLRIGIGTKISRIRNTGCSLRQAFVIKGSISNSPNQSFPDFNNSEV